ncbi:MAG TPA: desulfoferrodoxin FeS4 iron-binding domain-containing protein [Candidatus Atribacteria bacterium]|nr:desulfoferrodoxin FeS4 iron-binding domain-containing protein [Candidatus Atribacteria bacterium]
MPEKKETYRCNACGNVVEVEESEKEDLTCCGEPMVKVEEEKPKGGGCCRK